MHKQILFSPPDISGEEIREVVSVLKSGWITTGPRVKQFEKNLADYCGTSRVVCLNSGLAAEELNLRILGIGEGDEVIVPAYTYTATASAVYHVGATVKLIDSQIDSWEMDYDQLEAAITERTKAIIPVEIGGIPCDYDRIFDIVEHKKGIFQPKGNTELGQRIQESLGRIAIVSDSAHALGTEWHGKKAGNIADFTSFSFHAVKNLTTAEGGAATWKDIPDIDNTEIYNQYQLYSLHGQSKDALTKTEIGSWEYDIEGLWYKCNMTDIAAAIGLRQLERYQMLLNRRKEIIMEYDRICDALGISHLVHYGIDYTGSGHLYITRIPGINESERNDIIAELAQNGITTNVHYKPLPMMSAYKKLGFDISDFPHAYNYYANEITLPLHTSLITEDVAYIGEQIARLKSWRRDNSATNEKERDVAS